MSQESEVLERITAAFRCAFPVVALKTFEVARARAAVKKVAADLGRHYHEMPFKLVPDPSGGAGSLKAVPAARAARAANRGEAAGRGEGRR